MAINGKTKVLGTPPLTWVSAQLSYVWVQDGEHDGVVRIFIGLFCKLWSLIIYIIYIAWNNFSPTRSVMWYNFQVCNMHPEDSGRGPSHNNTFCYLFQPAVLCYLVSAPVSSPYYYCIMETGGTQEAIQHEVVVATWRIPRNGHSMHNRQSYNRLATSKESLCTVIIMLACIIKYNSLISAVRHGFNSSPSYSLLNTEVVFQN